jgi:hypothetical protein
MIRFLPDTWRDALLRPIAMAAPDAGVYVEIMAPDMRFAVIALLILVLLAFAWRIRWRELPVLPLLLWVIAAFAAWLFTSGNGRYFIPVLLVAGPLCMSLVYRLPSTRSFRLAVALGIVAVQALLLVSVDPRDSWALASWSDRPFFQVSLDEEARTEPATYVTLTNISYSLIAPRFPAASRWVNISSLPDVREGSPDTAKAQALFASSKSLNLLIPTAPDYITERGLPTEALSDTINGMLGTQRLKLADPEQCRLLHSRGLASMALRDLDKANPATLAKFGFWICPLKYPVEVAAKPELVAPTKVQRAVAAVEKRCPRFFQPGQISLSRLEGGWLRVYPQSDLKLYVLDDGQVFYKYMRALNPELIGETDEVAQEQFKMDCTAIRGRSGLPWEREI